MYMEIHGDWSFLRFFELGELKLSYMNLQKAFFGSQYLLSYAYTEGENVYKQ